MLAEGENILRVIDDYTYVCRVINDPIYLHVSRHIQVAERVLAYAEQEEQDIYQDFCELLILYENAIEKRPNEVERMRGMEEKAEGVVDRLFLGAEKVLDAGLQLKMLKMAQNRHTLNL